MILTQAIAKEISRSIIESFYELHHITDYNEETISNHKAVLHISSFLLNCKQYNLIDEEEICIGLTYIIATLIQLESCPQTQLEGFNADDEFLCIIAFMLAAKGNDGNDDVFDNISFLMAYSSELPTNHPMYYPIHFRSVYQKKGYTLNQFKTIRQFLGSNYGYQDAVDYLESCGFISKDNNNNTDVIGAVFWELNRLRKFNQTEIAFLKFHHYKLPRDYRLTKSCASIFFGKDSLPIFVEEYPQEAPDPISPCLTMLYEKTESLSSYERKCRVQKELGELPYDNQVGIKQNNKILYHYYRENFLTDSSCSSKTHNPSWS